MVSDNDWAMSEAQASVKNEVRNVITFNGFPIAAMQRVASKASYFNFPICFMISFNYSSYADASLMTPTCKTSLIN